MAVTPKLTASVVHAPYETQQVWYIGQPFTFHSLESVNEPSKDAAIDKEFIRFESSFKQQFHDMAEYYVGLSFQAAKNIFAKSLSLILELCPDVMSMQLTYERSILYTIKKDGFTFFLQHFFEVEDSDDDEAILTVYEGKEKLPSYAGRLLETMSHLSAHLPHSHTMSEIDSTMHEFSY